MTAIRQFGKYTFPSCVSNITKRVLRNQIFTFTPQKQLWLSSYISFVFMSRVVSVESVQHCFESKMKSRWFNIFDPFCSKNLLEFVVLTYSPMSSNELQDRNRGRTDELSYRSTFTSLLEHLSQPFTRHFVDGYRLVFSIFIQLLQIEFAV